ncbi:hypothetical protein BaRGS_00008217, partial [Batillaria attramentaria]
MTAMETKALRQISVDSSKSVAGCERETRRWVGSPLEVFFLLFKTPPETQSSSLRSQLAFLYTELLPRLARTMDEQYVRSTNAPICMGRSPCTSDYSLVSSTSGGCFVTTRRSRQISRSSQTRRRRSVDHPESRRLAPVNCPLKSFSIRRDEELFQRRRRHQCKGTRVTFPLGHFITHVSPCLEIRRLVGSSGCRITSCQRLSDCRHHDESPSEDGANGVNERVGSVLSTSADVTDYDQRDYITYDCPDEDMALTVNEHVRVTSPDDFALSPEILTMNQTISPVAATSKDSAADAGVGEMSVEMASGGTRHPSSNPRYPGVRSAGNKMGILAPANPVLDTFQYTPDLVSGLQGNLEFVGPLRDKGPMQGTEADGKARDGHSVHILKSRQLYGGQPVIFAKVDTAA